MKKIIKKVARQNHGSFISGISVPTQFDNFRSSILVVSLVFNAFVFIAWIVVRVTSQYDQQIVSFLFNR